MQIFGSGTGMVPTGFFVGVLLLIFGSNLAAKKRDRTKNGSF